MENGAARQAAPCRLALCSRPHLRPGWGQAGPNGSTPSFLAVKHTVPHPLARPFRRGPSHCPPASAPRGSQAAAQPPRGHGSDLILDRAELLGRLGLPAWPAGPERDVNRFMALGDAEWGGAGPGPSCNLARERPPPAKVL